MRFESKLIGLMLTACCACGATGESAPAPGITSGDTPQPTTEEWSIPMPPDTRVVTREDLAGNEGSSSATIWLTSETDVPDTISHFSAVAGMGTAYDLAGQRCLDAADGTRVCVAPASELPDRLTAPSGARTLISLRQPAQQLGCPPCPEGFVGTLVPSCDCP
ncbi:MAG: hypothetical protein GXP55_12175 [Deltaproteobacteria bacterium]|nr:hypothetical protein [Deltaproteobacteria bacterium]